MDEDEYEEYLEEEEARLADEAYMNLSDLLFNQPPEAI